MASRISPFQRIMCGRQLSNFCKFPGLINRLYFFFSTSLGIENLESLTSRAFRRKARCGYRGKLSLLAFSFSWKTYQKCLLKSLESFWGTSIRCVMFRAVRCSLVSSCDLQLVLSSQQTPPHVHRTLYISDNPRMLACDVMSCGWHLEGVAQARAAESPARQNSLCLRHQRFKAKSSASEVSWMYAVCWAIQIVWRLLGSVNAL